MRSTEISRFPSGSGSVFLSSRSRRWVASFTAMAGLICPIIGNKVAREIFMIILYSRIPNLPTNHWLRVGKNRLSVFKIKVVMGSYFA